MQDDSFGIKNSAEKKYELEKSRCYVEKEEEKKYQGLPEEKWKE